MNLKGKISKGNKPNSLSHFAIINFVNETDSIGKIEMMQEVL